MKQPSQQVASVYRITAGSAGSGFAVLSPAVTARFNLHPHEVV